MSDENHKTRMIWHIIADLNNPMAEPFAVIRTDASIRSGDGVEGTVISLHWERADAEAACRGLDEKSSRRAHKIMTPEEYATMPLIGWHEVCRDVDGFGGVGIRFLGEVSLSSGEV